MTRYYNNRRPPYRLVLLLLAGGVLGGCSSAPKDAGPTLKSLENKKIVIDTNKKLPGSKRRAKESYERLLRQAEDERIKKKAMKRLADLELKTGEDPGIDTSVAPDDGVEPDYDKAIRLYSDLLRQFPNSPDNEKVLYQLARAYEQKGDLENALKALTQLIKQFPNSRYRAETQFRRGEILFVFGEYIKAERAYADVVKFGKKTPFFQRAIYKHGWSIYKQDRFEDALKSFISLLDNMLANKRLADRIEKFDFLSRGDQELVKDVFRVVSLSFDRLNIKGYKAVADFFARLEPKRNYEFLVYRSLGDKYVKDERFLDAAETYIAFGDARPEHPQNILMLMDGIELFTKLKFKERVLETKKKAVQRFSQYLEYWSDNTHYGFDDHLIKGGESTREKIESFVAQSLEELGRYYHNLAQKENKPQYYSEAIKWYQTFLRTFLQHPKSPEINFLLAEASFEDKRYAEAIREYEKTAYNYPRHKMSAEAGYAALLAYEEYKKLLQEPDQKQFWNQLSISSAERFSKLFPKDKRTPQVLVRVVDEMYEAEQYQKASVFAKRILDLADRVDPQSYRRAQIIIAHANFENGDYRTAEEMYREALAKTQPNDKLYQGLLDRLAASVYKQAEQLKENGKLAAAVEQFLRVGTVAPTSAIRINAEYDAAASLIALKQWDRAIEVLEEFKRKYPTHELTATVDDKLAVAYMASGDKIEAARYLVAMAAKKTDPALQRDTMLQAAELYEQGEDYQSAANIYKEFIQKFPTPVDLNIEMRYKLAGIYGDLNQPNSRVYWLKTIVEDVKPDHSGVSDRTRFLAASAALELAEPTIREFERIKLVQPLKQTVKRKRAAMEAVLRAFDQAAAYRVAEVTTAATYQMGRVYAEFSRELLASERPAGLSPEALEQYELVLEDQAFPLEEKAIEIYEANARRIQAGIYDEWIDKSIIALGQILPARYGKQEKGFPVVNVIY